MFEKNDKPIRLALSETPEEDERIVTGHYAEEEAALKRMDEIERRHNKNLR